MEFGDNKVNLSANSNAILFRNLVWSKALANNRHDVLSVVSIKPTFSTKFSVKYSMEKNKDEYVKKKGVSVLHYIILYIKIIIILLFRHIRNAPTRNLKIVMYFNLYSKILITYGSVKKTLKFLNFKIPRDANLIVKYNNVNLVINFPLKIII